MASLVEVALFSKIAQLRAFVLELAIIYCFVLSRGRRGRKLVGEAESRVVVVVGRYQEDRRNSALICKPIDIEALSTCQRPRKTTTAVIARMIIDGTINHESSLNGERAFTYFKVESVQN
jgi:hypothetical protein